MAKVGDPAPQFDTVDEQGNPVKLSEFNGVSAVALVFYPKDDTPG
jgi:thioredoxin-dependent peroxiredoxin